MRKSELGKRYFAKIAACILAVAGLSISTAYALNEINLKEECSLTVNIDETGSYAMDLATISFAAKIYKVADVSSTGTYTALEGYTGLDLETAFTENAEEDIFYWSEYWNTKAQEAAVIAETKTADGTITVANNTGILEEMDAGMYLVMVDNVATATSEYRFSPVLVCLPTNPYLMNVSTNEEDNEYWYDVTVTLKPELDLDYGKLEIQKTLTSYNTSLKDVSFVFLIEAKDEAGNVIYSNVASTTHSAAGTKSAVVDGVPIGVELTVTEIYSGASYTVSGADSRTTTILSVEEMAKVEFVNEYDDELIPGYGVVNNFTYDEDEGWVWTQLKDNSQADE